LKNMCFTSDICETYHTSPLSVQESEETVTDRQEKVEGVDQQALASATVVMVGGGCLGSEIGEGLSRKGVGHLIILDDDVVSPSNLSRQRFFARDLYKNKALCLARNLAEEGFCQSVLTGYALSFQEALKRGIDLRTGCKVAVVGVDNNPARVATSVYFRQAGIPVIFTAVSRTANNGYVFVQEAGEGKACFGCLFADAINDQTYPCPGTPAVKEGVVFP
jgi:molybdopterin/thiamine biosynthesis adenylyltransferase